TDPVLCAARGLIDVALEAAAGGATLVQLRDPHAKGRDYLEQARALVAALHPKGIPLIVNDRPDIALAAGAAGVHVGQDDVPPAAARGIMGLDAIIGLSITGPDQISAVDAGIVDHLGVGPVFGPGVKTDAKPAIGLDGLRLCVRLSPLPVVAIGAIALDNAADCIRAGAQGVAVISAIAAQPDPRLAAVRLRTRVDAALAEHAR
ncbi:MAG: thiamine phosphate synthase, partial [Beijerinckiaceae bacterium]